MPPSDKEKSQKAQEKYQAVLSALLREDDNKYCVDCDSKGPRWASWNLGVFICIRCAGIHRNLGVHISKVKSVNLDQWTAEQVASMQAMGNAKARTIYENNLPESFRRSQTDSAMEQFIRGKYESKKWIAKEWKPQTVTIPAELKDDDSVKDKKKSANKINLDPAFMKLDTTSSKKSSKLNTSQSEKPTSAAKTEELINVQKNEPNLFELESLDVFATKPTTVQNEDQFDLFNLGPMTEQGKDTSAIFPVDFLGNLPSSDLANLSLTDNSTQFKTENTLLDNPSKSSADLSDLLIGSNDLNPTQGNKCLDKNSILALYSQGVKSNVPANNFSTPSSNNMFMSPSNSFNGNGKAFNSVGSNMSNLTNHASANLHFNQTSSIQNMNLFGQNINTTNKANNNFISQDMFSNAFFNPTSFTPNMTAAKQEFPTIGNTMSTDLWQ